MSTLNLASKATAYENPADTGLKPFWWDRSVQGLVVRRPQSPAYVIAPGDSQVVFSGARSTTFASNTELTLALSALAGDRYRLSWTGGTNPTFRTSRALTPSGASIVVTVNTNGTATFTTDQAGGFSAVVAGDWLLVPGVRTGDADSPFDEINCGTWVVVAAGALYVQVRRLDGEVFEALAETVTATGNGNLVAYTAAGVQLGDALLVESGFAQVVRGTYLVDRVSPTYVEFLSTAPLPTSAVAAVGATGVVFYGAARRFVRVESDQEVALRWNGSTDDTCRVVPWVAGTSAGAGWDEKVGTAWSLTIVNKSSRDANVRVFSAE